MKRLISIVLFLLIPFAKIFNWLVYHKVRLEYKRPKTRAERRRVMRTASKHLSKNMPGKRRERRKRAWQVVKWRDRQKRDEAKND